MPPMSGPHTGRHSRWARPRQASSRHNCASPRVDRCARTRAGLPRRAGGCRGHRRAVGYPPCATRCTRVRVPTSERTGAPHPGRIRDPSADPCGFCVRGAPSEPGRASARSAAMSAIWAPPSPTTWDRMSARPPRSRARSLRLTSGAPVSRRSAGRRTARPSIAREFVRDGQADSRELFRRQRGDIPLLGWDLAPSVSRLSLREPGRRVRPRQVGVEQGHGLVP